MQCRGKGYNYEVTVTPLHLACERNNEDAVKVLLHRSDLQINIRDSHGKTPLHYVPNDTIVELLLNHPNVDVNATDDFNDTPLHNLVIFDYDIGDSHYNSEILMKIVQKLLDHPFIRINQKNVYGETPFDSCIEDRSDYVVLHKKQIQCF